ACRASANSLSVRVSYCPRILHADHAYSPTARSRNCINNARARSAGILLKECPHTEDFGGWYWSILECLTSRIRDPTRLMPGTQQRRNRKVRCSPFVRPNSCKRLHSRHLSCTKSLERTKGNTGPSTLTNLGCGSPKVESIDKPKSKPKTVANGGR